MTVVNGIEWDNLSTNEKIQHIRNEHVRVKNCMLKWQTLMSTGRASKLKTPKKSSKQPGSIKKKLSRDYDEAMAMLRSLDKMKEALESEGGIE